MDNQLRQDKIDVVDDRQKSSIPRIELFCFTYNILL